MSDSALPSPTALPKFWVTLVWVGVFFVANVVANVAGMAVYLVWMHETPAQLLKQIHGLANDGSFLAVIEIVSAPLLVAFAFLVARLSSRDVAGFLGLRWPSWRYVAIGLLGFAALFAADYFWTLRHEDVSAAQFSLQTYRSAQSEHALALLFLGFAVAAPLIEETSFRGFIYSRLALRLGAWPAILLTAVLWASLHVQYDLAAMAEIFIMGLMLGALRRYSGSMIWTTILHGAWNALSLVETIYALNS